MGVIAVVGTLDSKGPEHEFVAARIREHGHRPLLIDIGTLNPPEVPPDILREEVLAAGDADPSAAMLGEDRGKCMAVMATALPKLLQRLARLKQIDGVIALGGSGGTAIASAGMRALPTGFPRLLVSTMASGNVAPYLGTQDILMMPSIVDVAGLNRISRLVFTRAAAAICGMVTVDCSDSSSRPVIAASMFGNTTDCIEQARPVLESAGYEVLVFHATGTGGRTMESLVSDGMIDGVLDVTTTELADELAGGVLSAGPDRLTAAARRGIPQVVAPGCLDMINFGEPSTIPERYQGRCFYEHNPQVTLMRTSAEESVVLGRQLAEKVNCSTGPVSVVLPLRGLSVIGAAGGPFFDAEADAALFTAISQHLKPGIPTLECDCAINSPEFSEVCVRELLRYLPDQESISRE
ncbi:MAG: Tm-1-like ATP-binding domain-containing protein [Planctomycetaceae bacterium]